MSVTEIIIDLANRLRDARRRTDEALDASARALDRAEKAEAELAALRAQPGKLVLPTKVRVVKDGVISQNGNRVPPGTYEVERWEPRVTDGYPIFFHCDGLPSWLRLGDVEPC